MKQPIFLLTCALWGSLMLTVNTAGGPSEICGFPDRCSCTTGGSGKLLSCVTMEKCLDQEGMDEIASAMSSKSCPLVSKLGFTITCSHAKVEPEFEITAQLFRHSQWRRVDELRFGIGCRFAFRTSQVLSHLPNLRRFAVQNAKISINLSRFSEIICCPPDLKELYFEAVSEEIGGTRFGRNSFTGFPALSRLFMVYSIKLINLIDLVLNTSAQNFKFFWSGTLQPESRKFSSISIKNLANKSALDLTLSDCNANFNLDAPASIEGFEFSNLALHKMRLGYIGDRAFRGFSFKSLSVTGCGLNEKLLPKLLGAIKRAKDRNPIKALAVELQLRKPLFLFDEFNSLCIALPYLHRLSISFSTISFADPIRYFNCSQLLELSLTNCNLTDDKLPQHSFSGLIQLKNLRLMSNLFNTFPKNALRSAKNLEYLDLSSNPKMELHATSLRGILPNLITLRLSQTVFSEALTDAFVGQPYLTELHMDQTRPIGHKKPPFIQTWFRNCSRLRSLSLAKNGYIGKTVFRTDGFFDPLVNLEELDLSRCGFGQQTDGTVKSLLTSLASLTTLRLADNGFGRLELIIRNHMPNLTLLDVSSNPFSSIPKDLLLSTTPRLKTLYLMKAPIVNIDPETFSRLPNIRIKFGRNQFACTCDLLPFTDWLREQWPIYQAENIGNWLRDAVCYTALNETVRLLDFHKSWWDCYNRILIMSLVTCIAALLLILGTSGLLVKYHWKLQYNLLVFCIRHRLVRRVVPAQWTYDGCFIYDETDSRVSQWVEELVHKLETDLQLRLYDPEQHAPAGANVLDEAASAIDKSRHAVLVLTRGFLENRLNMYSAQWSNESQFMRRISLAVMVMRERLSESDLRVPGCKGLHSLYRMCKPGLVIDCSDCGVGGNSANRLGLLLYKGAGGKTEGPAGSGSSETEPLLKD